jgi:hypothetical protein
MKRESSLQSSQGPLCIQVNQFYAILPYLFNIHFNIILPIPIYRKCCSSVQKFRLKFCVRFSCPHACYLSCLTRPLHFNAVIIFVDAHKLFSFFVCGCLCPTLASDALALWSVLRWQTKFHTHLNIKNVKLCNELRVHALVVRTRELNNDTPHV